MNTYTTVIRAVSPVDKKIRLYAGPSVPGVCFADAQAFCENNGLGYCEVDGILLAEIPCIGDTYYPDADKMIDYEHPKLN